MGYNFGVGREAPAFALTSTDGDEINLKQYRRDWYPVLAFVPAADAGAAERLAGLNEAANALWGLRGQVLAVCDGAREDVVRLAGGVERLAFPILTDGAAVARRYGALHSDGRLLPMAFVIDRSGKIVWSGEGDAALSAPALTAAFREVVR